MYFKVITEKLYTIYQLHVWHIVYADCKKFVERKQNTKAHTGKELNVSIHLLLTFPITYGWPEIYGQVTFPFQLT